MSSPSIDEGKGEDEEDAIGERGRPACAVFPFLSEVVLGHHITGNACSTKKGKRD